MIRYVVSFPGEMRMEWLHQLLQAVKEAADAREWRDVVLTNGGTITRLDQRPRCRYNEPRIVRR